MNAVKNTPLEEWILPAALLLLSPVFLFPRKQTVWVLLLVPLLFVFVLVRRRIRFVHTPLDWMIALLSFQVIISGLFVADMNLSLPKVTGFFFGIAVFYALGPVFHRTERLKWGILVFILGGTALALTGLLGMSRSDEPKYIRALYGVLKSLPSIHFGFPGAEEGFHPNAVGGGLTVILPLCVVLLLSYLVRNKKEFRIVPSSGGGIFLAACFLIMTFVMLLTQSRSSFAGMFVFTWLLLFTGLRRRKILAAAVTVLMLSLLTAVFFLAGSKKLPYTDLESRNKLIGRVSVFWAPGLKEIKLHPFFGMGMNQARTIPQVGVTQGHLHNLCLHTAAELGIPALIALLVLLYLSAAMCIKIWKTAPEAWMKAAGLGLGGGQLALFVFGFLDVIPLGAKVGIFFWFSLALIASLYSFTQKTINPQQAEQA